MFVVIRLFVHIVSVCIHTFSFWSIKCNCWFIINHAIFTSVLMCLFLRIVMHVPPYTLNILPLCWLSLLDLQLPVIRLCCWITYVYSTICSIIVCARVRACVINYNLHAVLLLVRVCIKKLEKNGGKKKEGGDTRMYVDLRKWERREWVTRQLQFYKHSNSTVLAVFREMKFPKKEAHYKRQHRSTSKLLYRQNRTSQFLTASNVDRRSSHYRNITATWISR